jgi:flagellar basal-body rod modification protein FlgD
MADNTIGPSVGLGATYDPNANKRVANQNLGKDDFLKLMITQMQHQDPLDPMDNTEQIAQQAQFTTLEQMQNLNSSMQTLIDIYQTGNRSSAVSMIGADVEGFLNQESEDGSTSVVDVKGRVKGIDFSNGATTLVLESETGEVRVPFNQINKVMDPRESLQE